MSQKPAAWNYSSQPTDDPALRYINDRLVALSKVLNNSLPPVTNKANQVLSTDGEGLSWVSVIPPRHLLVDDISNGGSPNLFGVVLSPGGQLQFNAPVRNHPTGTTWTIGSYDRVFDSYHDGFLFSLNNLQDSHITFDDQGVRLEVQTFTITTQHLVTPDVSIYGNGVNIHSVGDTSFSGTGVFSLGGGSTYGTGMNISGYNISVISQYDLALVASNFLLRVATTATAPTNPVVITEWLDVKVGGAVRRIPLYT